MNLIIKAIVNFDERDSEQQEQQVIIRAGLYGIEKARTEVRTCGWLAQVDENGGSIFHYRPHSKGAADMGALVFNASHRKARIGE